MSIDWNAFTPLAALTGGLLIGLAAALLIIINGRIAGINGILGGLLKPHTGDIVWRFAFIAGLIAAPVIYAMVFTLPAISIEADTPALIISGLLVGLGARYGSGCTSGHGVCGISRLSPRSMIATLVFMVAGFMTVYLVRHI